MWMKENRSKYSRRLNGYSSDLTDAELALIAPVIPPAKHGGAKRTVDVREIVNGIMYVPCLGCQWRAIPKDLPPRSMVCDYFDLWGGTARSTASTRRCISHAARKRKEKPARQLPSSTVKP